MASQGGPKYTLSQQPWAQPGIHILLFGISLLGCRLICIYIVMLWQPGVGFLLLLWFRLMQDPVWSGQVLIEPTLLVFQQAFHTYTYAHTQLKIKYGLDENALSALVFVYLLFTVLELG